jgi:hypothetical protein
MAKVTELNPAISDRVVEDAKKNHLGESDGPIELPGTSVDLLGLWSAPPYITICLATPGDGPSFMQRTRTQTDARRTDADGRRHPTFAEPRPTNRGRGHPTFAEPGPTNPGSGPHSAQLTRISSFGRLILDGNSRASRACDYGHP